MTLDDPASSSAAGLSARVADADFAGLMCARLCHDLISPAGAIGNGVELLRELGGGGGPELELIGRSAAQVTAALQFLRLAFGPAATEDTVGLASVQRIARSWFDHQRPALVWPDGADEAPLREARLLAALLMIAVAALPRGGEVTVAAAPGALRVEATGRALLTPEAAEAWLAGLPDAPAPTSREVHWPLAARHAAAAGMALAFARHETTLILTAG